MLNRFYFRGFEPAAALESETDVALSEIRNLAPSDSSFLGSVERVPDGYIARLDIYSMHGPFMADSSASEPELAVKQVLVIIRNQLDQWKHRRLARERTQGNRDHYLIQPEFNG